MAGNVGKNDYNLKIDKTTPSCKLQVISGEKGNGNWYITSPKISFVDSSGNSKAPTDSNSGILGYNISSSSTSSFYYSSLTTTVYSNTPSTGRTYYGHVSDNAGNVGRCEILIYRDSSAPRCTVVISSGTEGENGWYRSSVGIKATPTGEYNSGIHSFDITSSSSATYSQTYSSSKTYHTTTQIGDTTGTTYYCHVKDKAGNTRTVTGPTIKKDTVKPSCEIRSKSNFSGWNSGAQTYKPVWGAVQVSLYDKSGATSWGMSMGTNTVVYNGMTQMSIQMATGTFYGYTKDDAGNTSSCSATVTHSFFFGGDTCYLTFSGTKGSNNWYKSGGTVTVHHDDAANFEWTVNGEDKGKKSSHYLGSQGTYYVQARNTGFLEDIGCSLMVNIDWSAPSNFTVSTSKSSSLTNPSDSYLYAELSATDNISGISYWGYYNSGWSYRYSSTSPYKWYFFGEKNHSGSFIVCDGAGNCTSTKSATMVIDYCNESLNESNAGAWGSCSASCGEGTKKRTYTWTGTSGATCTAEEEASCYSTTGCVTASSICEAAGGSGTSLFGSSIGYNAGVKNYGSFARVSDEKAYECSCNSGTGIKTNSGYHRICSNSSACGGLYKYTADEIRRLDVLEDGDQDCYFDRYWCICNTPIAIDRYSYGGGFIEVYDPF